MKPSGKTFFQPDFDTRVYGQKLIQRIMEKWTPPDHYSHLTQGGYIPWLHAFKRYQYLAKVDISSFFPSLTKNRVARNLHKVLNNYEEAWTAAGMSCVHFGDARFLPVGFVQSPLIATLCLSNSRVGSAMSTVGDSGRVKVHCYFDDIVLCSNSSYQLNKALSKICGAVTNSGLSLNEQKTKRARHRLTVFNVDCYYQHLSIAEDRMRDFREVVTSLEMDAEVQGILSYVRRINRTQAKELEILATSAA